MPVAPKIMVGVVVSAGKMQRAVKVRVAGQVYNSFLRKQFGDHKNYLVSDPNDSIRLGDVVRIEDAGRKISPHINHVVTEIVAPWGPAINERPPVLSALERHAIWKEKYDAKIERRTGKKPAWGSSGNIDINVAEKREGSREAKEAGRETQENEVEGMV